MHKWLVWNILFPVQEWAKRHPTIRLLQEMEAAETLGPANIVELQERRLRAFIHYTYSHVPYVRSAMQVAGVRPSAIKGVADLTRLPLMQKADIRQNRVQLRSECAGKLVSFSTGGSTGAPLLFDLSTERIGAQVACRQRASRWWGLSAGDREFALWGSPIEVSRQDYLRRLRDLLFATELFSAFDMSEEVMSSYVDRLCTGAYRMIFGYPSSIYLLCQHARCHGRDLSTVGVRTVFVTGEVLFPHQRKLITETFSCGVANGYGGRDSGFIAHECPAGGMHIMADAVILEIIDREGRPVSPGEPGEIVVTDLFSREAPFLRYATGDSGVLSTEKCACGRPLPLLEQLEGRTTDFIIAPDGTLLHALAVIYVLREIDGIEQFRIRQKRPDTFLVQIVKNEQYHLASEERIRTGLQQRLRAPLTVRIEYLTSIPPEASGKFRYVISEVHAEPAAAQHSALSFTP